jgi:hypothetical protein
MSDNIRSIETPADKRKAAIEVLRRMLDTDAMQEALLIAKLRKIQFDAYVGAGFTREEALRIIMGGQA